MHSLLHLHSNFKLVFLFLLIFLIFGCSPKNIEQQNSTAGKNNCDSLLSMAEQLVGSNTALSTMYLNQAHSIIEAHPCPNDEACYHLIKGRIYYYKDEYLSSIQHLDTAIRVFTSIENKKGLAKAYSFIGGTQTMMGNYPAAIKSCLESISMNSAIGDKKSAACVSNFLGNIYLEQNDYKQALYYVNLAYTITQEDSISLHNANVLTTKGKIFVQQGKLEQAEIYLLKAYDIRIRCANIRHIASSLGQLANLRYLQNNYADAKKYLAEAEHIYLELDEKTGLFNMYNTFSKIALAENNLNDAFSYAEKAYDISKIVNSSMHLSKASQLLSEIYQKKNDPVKALVYYKQFHEYNSQLISQEKNKLIANMEYNNELLNTTKDNEILSQKNKIKQQQLAILTLVTVVLLILLITLSVLFRLKHKSLRNKQSLLAKEKEMAEAENKLHLKEKIILENDLELKNKELTSKTIELLHQIETLQSLAEKIENLNHSGSKKEVEGILHELNMKTRENVWDDFHNAFNSVHNDFYESLFKICPDLSAMEIKIAALLKLNLSTKEIAAISYKSESAVKTARHRLRQRLDLKPGDNLINFLMKI